MSELSGLTIGVIGLGLMGKPMARNLAAAGADLVILNRSQGVIDALAREGMLPATDATDLAARSDIIITLLPDTPTLEAMLGDAMVGLKPGSLVIDMGTSLFPVTKELAAMVEKTGAFYVDAPVSGGTIGAVEGTLTIMAGGTEAAFEKALPVLRVLGSKITHVGAVGAGQVAKAANQVIVGLTIGAVSEALALAAKAGVDPAKVREALSGGFADSRILEVHGQRMVAGDFTPGARCPIQLKDMDQAATLGDQLGLDLPATKMSRTLYEKVIDLGNADLDHAGLITAIDPDWPVKKR